MSASYDFVPSVTFCRTRLPLTTLLSTMDRVVKSVRVVDEMAGIDTFTGAALSDENRILLSNPALRERLVDFCEIVAVKPDAISATPLVFDPPEPTDFDDLETEDGEDGGWVIGENDDDYFPLTEDRPSARLADTISRGAGVERPCFGRRLLLVNYEPDLPEHDALRAKAKVRKRLGNCRAVWQGRTFEAYAFVDNRSLEQIMDPLFDFLDSEDIADYLLARPTHMVEIDKSGLSPLATWMETGWRASVASIGRSHRNARS